ncbi:nitrite reductase small subunit NirD [soil metagenome]
MTETLCVGKVGDIPDGGSTVVDFLQRAVAVFRVGDEYYAIDDCCPHAGASLAAGHVENGTVTCPWHYWRFRLNDGAWADNPRIKTGCYNVSIVHDEIHISKPSQIEPGRSS